MRVRYPLTIVAAFIAFGIALFATFIGSQQGMREDAANFSSWPTFVVAHVGQMSLFVVPVVLVAWLIEKRLRQSPTAA